MTLEQKRQRIQHAMNNELAHLNTSQAQRDRLLAVTAGGETVNRKSKLSFGLVLALVLICISITAVAVTAVINGYYEKVAQMDADGSMMRWEMKDKIQFVNIMQEGNLPMNEADYALMMNEKESDENREAAADRIIYTRYGELIQKDVEQWEEQPADITEVAPNEVIIFQEQYLAGHPEGINTKEDYQAYTDALGYYLRDVYYPAYRTRADQLPEATPLPDGTEEAAVRDLKGYMTEVYSWHPDAVDNIVPEIKWDEEYQLWEVSGEVSKASMELAFEPVLEGKTVEETETGYRLTILVDPNGFTRATQDKQAFSLEAQQHAKNNQFVSNVSYDEAIRMAKDALKAHYNLSEAEVNSYFYDSFHYVQTGDRAQISTITFRNHYSYQTEKMYGVVINRAEGRVTDVFSYRENDMTPTWQLLSFAARTEQRENWYVRWSLENKKALIGHMKACNILPEHAFWQQVDPSEEAMDAFVAETFGAKDYPSGINTWRMVETLLGDAETWSGADHALFMEMETKYNLSRSDGLEKLDGNKKEIGEKEAIAIIRKEFAAAWNMEETEMDAWQIVAQQVHDDYLDRGMVYWRVYLTRPMGTEKDARFQGRMNFNYRVKIDGTVVDASVLPGWFSPAQHKAVLEETASYDNELFRHFDRYAQQNGLMYAYEDFFHWPLAHQKACADQLRPLIQERMQQDAGFADPRLMVFANHVYGVPENGMIPEEKAQEIAFRHAQKAFDLTDQEYSLLLPETMLLDVTDPQKPFYQIGLSSEESWTSSIRAGLEPSVYYVVEVDACTGEILNTYMYARDDGETGVEAWERWY